MGPEGGAGSRTLLSGAASCIVSGARIALGPRRGASPGPSSARARTRRRARLLQRGPRRAPACRVVCGLQSSCVSFLISMVRAADVRR